MKLYLDNIIFSLQKAGGISVVWIELMKRVLKDPDIDAYFLEKINQNLFRNQIEIPNERIITDIFTRFPTFMERYINIYKLKEKGIFHSSYYRIAKNPSLINVTTVHDFTFEYFRKGLIKYAHSIQKGNAIKNSDKIICISENTKNDLLKFYPDTPRDKIIVIYNGVDEQYNIIDKKDDDELKKIIPFSRNEYSIFVGDRKGAYKNFNLAVEACKKTKTPLVLIGGRNITKDETEFLSKNLGKAGFSHLGGISNATLNFLYNHALCLLYPSSYEGFGIPVIEAQKAGCPVIAVNASSIPEVIGPVSTLLSKPRADNIAEMIQQLKLNTDFVNSQIKIGLENSQRFSWEKCYLDTKTVYRELYENNIK